MKVRLRPHHAPRFATLQPSGDPSVTALPLCGYRQARPYTDGFAAALMVMRYFGSTLPGLDLFQRLGTGPEGIRQSALVRELRAAGLSANARHDLDFGRICRAIDRNKLILGYLHDDHHWVVIYGYGRDPNRVLVADPAPDSECEESWAIYSSRLAGFGIICSDPHGSAAVRQKPLGLAQVPAPSTENPPLHMPPPLPLPQLRCEVHTYRRIERKPEPAQLAFAFVG